MQGRQEHCQDRVSLSVTGAIHDHMETEKATGEQMAALREAFGVDDGGASALGWEAVRAFEAEHGVVLPEPYRSFVAEVSDGSFQGPPDYGLVALAELIEALAHDQSGVDR